MIPPPFGSGFEKRAHFAYFHAFLKFLVEFKLSCLTNQWSERNDSSNSISTNL